MITEALKDKIRTQVARCIIMGMRDPNSIYQTVLDTVPEALSNIETEMAVHMMCECAGIEGVIE